MRILDRIAGGVRRWALRGERGALMREARAMFARAARAFNAATDDRLTKNHWGSVSNDGINADLISDLATTRNRIRHERQNNGYLEGIVSTNELDIVGPQGPSLQLVSADEAWTARAERIWREFWANPDLNGQLSGAEMLCQAERQRWDCGESLWQIVTDGDASGVVKTRLLAIHPRRCETPYGYAATKDVTLGVRRTATGKPISYFIREEDDNELNLGVSYRFTEIPAEFIIHDYDVDEPGQARGVPDLACALQPVGQMREWDRDVQQAMRMAAMLGMFFYSEDPAASPMTLNGSIDLESGSGVALPPGYKPMQMVPQQPSQHYEAYRDGKLAEMGRPAGMPGMMVRLDSREHSYSSARFDGQIYDRAIRARQGRIERRKLNRLLKIVLREAQLARALPPAPPDLAVAWVWPARPHVDPVKEAEAIHQRLADGSQTRAGACAEYGLDYETTEAQREREAKRADAINMARIVEIDRLIAEARKANPALDVTWSQVLSAGGATTAPGAYLAAAMKPTETTAADPADREDDR